MSDILIIDGGKRIPVDFLKSYANQLNADGCKGCAFEEIEEWEMPCCKCKRSCKDYWRAKQKNDV